MKSIKTLIFSMIMLFTALLSFANTSVGSPKGSIDVSGSGAAIYNLQFEIPNGGSFSPQIGLEYNSQSSYGQAGYGFGISGLSVITCGNKNMYYDGEVGANDYFHNSTYFLDGKRLILKSGENGTEGAIYTLEGDPYTEIALHGYMTIGGTWFEVTTADGVKYQYGRTGNSALNFHYNYLNRCAAWYICTATDKYDNTINYHYTIENLCVLPDYISYGSNTNQERGIDCRIDFTYSDIAASNVRSFRIMGVQGSFTKKLSEVTCSINNQTYRRYVLGYNESSDNSNGKFSRLTTITEYNASGDNFPPVHINWNYLQSPNVSRITKSFPTDCSSTFREENDRSFIAMDMNGDGISDIIRITNVTGRYGADSGIYAYISYGNRSTSTSNISFSSSIVGCWRLEGNIDMGIFKRYSNGIAFADLNGDGLNDFVTQEYNLIEDQAQIKYRTIYGVDVDRGNTDDIGPFCNNLKSVNSKNPVFVTADFTGDGKSEIMYIEDDAVSGQYWAGIFTFDENRSETVYNVALYLYGKPKKMFTGDYNNDGLVDIIVLHDTGYKIYYNNGYDGNIENIFTELRTEYGTDLSNSWRVRQGDFNGDGLIDFVQAKSGDGKLYLYFNNGNGTFDQVVTPDFGVYDYGDSTKDDNQYCFEILDLDNDGLSDIFISKAMYNFHTGGIWGNSYYRYNRTYKKWLRSTGNNLELYQSYSIDREDDAEERYTFVGDFDGDGSLELANYGAPHNMDDGNFSENQIYIYKCGTNIPAKGRVSSITDSYGASTSISYESATSVTVPSSAQIAYPQIRCFLPLPVVSQLSVSGSNIYSHTVNYSYGDFRVHVGGKGALGFSSFLKNDLTLGITEKTEITNWNTTYWTPQRTVLTKTIGGNTETSVSTYTIHPDYASNNWCSTANSVCTTDLDGNITNTCNTIYDYQQGIHPDTQTVSYGDDGSYKEIQFPHYEEISGTYLPTSKVVGQQYRNEEYISTVTRYQYDQKGNPILVSENDNTEHNLQKTFTYDVYGNVLSETVDGDGVATMTKYYQYDASGRFVTRTYTVPSSVTKSYTYDIFGNLLSESDESNPSNILTDSHTYDGWGRKTSSTLADGNTISYIYEWDSDVQGARYKTVVNASNAPWTVTYYDVLGREIYTKTVGLGGVSVSDHTSYDRSGQVSQKRSVEGSQELIESFTYDNRGRIISDEFSTGLQTTYSYGARSVTETIDGRSTTKYYDEWGNVISVSDPVSNVTYTYSSYGKPREITSNSTTLTLAYDEVGNRISMSDPSAGNMQYAYDASGRLVSQTDARGVTTNYVYDALGRVESKEVGDETITYTYGTSGNEKNQLVSVSSSNGTINYTYDAWGNVTSKTRTMPGEAPLAFYYTYDDINRLDTQTYPDGFITANNYTLTGKLWAVTKSDRTSSLWAYSGYNGQSTKISYGGELYGFTPLSISPASVTLPITPIDPVDPVDPVDPIDPPISIYFEAVFDVHNYSISNITQCNDQGQPVTQQLVLNDNVLAENTYTYRASDGNLMSRSLHGEPTQDFSYDSADRLTTVSVASTQTMSMNYSANGNIDFKTGIGIYDYAGSKPHAVTSVDNIGGLISNSPQSITFNDFGKVSRIEEGDYVLQIIYGPDEERWKSVLYHNGSVVRSTVYFDDYESITENGVTRNWHDLGNGALYLTDSNGNEMELVAFTDHQGSILKLVDLDGNVKFDASYDVWGRQTINVNLLRYYHGYTGHEMIPELALINMNGRFYDPLLARFLSPDNYVQEPDNSQNFNRFSYCLNNPLKYTDPSGEFFGIDDVIIAGAIVFSTAGLVNTALNYQNISSFWHGLAYFGVGACASAVGAFGGATGILAAGALIGGGNDIVTQGFNKGWGHISWESVGINSILNAGFAYAGSLLGNSVGNIIDKSFPNISNGIIKSAVHSTIGTAVVTSTFDMASTAVNGGSFTKICKSGLNGLLLGGAIGFMSGLSTGYAEYIYNHSSTHATKANLANYDTNNSATTSTDLVPYYPQNDGAYGEWHTKKLAIGEKIDRYGSCKGRFLSYERYSIEARALPPNNNGEYHLFEVRTPFTVQESLIAPWFGKPGMGIQIRLDKPVAYYISNGNLIIVK